MRISLKENRSSFIFFSPTNRPEFTSIDGNTDGLKLFTVPVINVSSRLQCSIKNMFHPARLFDLNC